MRHQDKLPVILIGASTRALAFSCLRAGVQPYCVDLFADSDLQAVADVSIVPSDEYPQALANVISQYPSHWPVIYTGGIENHPQTYLSILMQRPVWGYTHPHPLHGRSIRNPKFLDSLAAKHGIHRPGHLWKREPENGDWLIKPLSSSGGRGIQRWSTGKPLSQDYYLEEYLSSETWSAIFVSHHKETRLLGCSRQFAGASWLHAPTPFSYCGNMGPQQLGQTILSQLQKLGTALSKEDPFLTGLFGIDFILKDHLVYLIEVNPRYTASVELLELAGQQSFLAEHLRTFGRKSGIAENQSSYRILGKAIYYAPSECVFPQEVPFSNYNIKELWEIPDYADIPVAGSSIHLGQPVMTLYAQGTDEQQVVHRLQEKAQGLDQLFFHGFA